MEDSHVKLRIGDLAPDFTLPSHLEDKSVTLNHLRGKNTVLVFYPAAFTPV
jgi:peroxiredoxin